MKHLNYHSSPPKGFALVVTLSLMVLLTVVAVGLLTLSTIALRSTTQGSAQALAQANARLALMVALGELQKEMGPDMRVSAESAIFDSNKATETIEGLDQSRWLASYNSWGGWLNGTYSPPDSSGSLTIADTYTPKREKMFRRWLLSLPEGQEKNVNAPNSIASWNNTNSVILVGPGSLGTSSTADRTTRAYLKPVGSLGKYAWWIAPENHKAKISLTGKPRTLAASQWEESQGNTAEVGVGILPGLDVLDSNKSLGDKLITAQTLRPAGVNTEVVAKHFFDLTASSRGVLTSVRTGHLKKDLSLLFEQNKAALPSLYRFNPGADREPSIRPMSPEIASKPVLRNRHFAPWTRMRHFYRMYRQDSDAEARSFATGGTDGSPGLTWASTKPYSDCNISVSSAWGGKDAYVRFPVLTSITYILSLKTAPTTSTRTADKGKYDLHYVAAPVYVYWNPYNVELRVRDKSLGTNSYLMQVQTLRGMFYKGSTFNQEVILDFNDEKVRFLSGSSTDIVFKPGEFRIFSPRGISAEDPNFLDVLPGFDPGSYGGLFSPIPGGPFSQTDNPKLEISFSPIAKSGNLFNSQFGNTPGSFVSLGYWSPNGDNTRGFLPFYTAVDWLNTAQAYTPITKAGNPVAWFNGSATSDNEPIPVGYIQMALKGIGDYHNKDLGWTRDSRCRNWIQAPPFYLGKGLYMSEDPKVGNTQRIDCPVEMRFGPLLQSGKTLDDIIQHNGNSGILGLDERLTALPCLELPTAPIASLAGFAGMRINPGWTDIATLNPDWKIGTTGSGRINTSGNSLFVAQSKAWAYQSGVTGPGIGNSFLHPTIPRTEVYQFFNNSISMEPSNFTDISKGYATPPTDTKAYCDYWDHALLLNDALWDDYYVSSLADQTRPGVSSKASLSENIQKLAKGEELANSRYIPYLVGRSATEVQTDLAASDGYLKAAKYLVVDGMFNVNSTSVGAWQALFTGIRERQVVYRDKNGSLRTVAVPSGKRIALSRFNTETTNLEASSPEFGVARDDGMQASSGVRFLGDSQLLKLAEECVKQVKQRGPFLNFSEFINRRLSNDKLGTMGALQSAIDYDDPSPDSGSINYRFKSVPDFMLTASDLGDSLFATPEAAVGSRFAGVPGYVIQSDLLKPIANTLSVRDDTFRIRAYGESLDKNGKILARAWCEAIVQRVPEYCDSSNDPEIPAREMTPGGQFSEASASTLTPVNRSFGRKFQIESFRWLNASEI